MQGIVLTQSVRLRIHASLLISFSLSVCLTFGMYNFFGVWEFGKTPFFCSLYRVAPQKSGIKDFSHNKRLFFGIREVTHWPSHQN